MKKITLFLFSLLCSFIINAQDITGDWYGQLDFGAGTTLRLVLHVSKAGDTYSSTMDSPDQKASGIPLSSTTYKAPDLSFSLESAKITFTGKLTESNKIDGIFNQGGKNIPLLLSREKIEKVAVQKSQEPQKPYPYYTEDVQIENAQAQIKLAATLSLPKQEGKFPVVVLISGSGPQNRDEEIMGHKPFLVLSDYLVRQGIGVLRYDDRGTGESEGVFSTATSKGFASDAQAVVQYLKTRSEIDSTQIGLIGHSEGGTIAPMLAASSKDIAFIVLLAGTGIKGRDILLLQQQLVGKAYHQSDEELKQTKTFYTGAFNIVEEPLYPESKEAKLKAYITKNLVHDPKTEEAGGMSRMQQVESETQQLLSPWMQYFISYDPAPTLQKVKCPVLAINGSKDLQVPPTENLSAIENALKKGGNKHYTIKKLENMNHLFQECETGSPEEYGKIEETISPKALVVVTEWIKQQIK